MNNNLVFKYNTPTGGNEVSHKTNKEGNIFHIQIEVKKTSDFVSQAFVEHTIEVEIPTDCDEVRIHYPK